MRRSKSDTAVTRKHIIATASQLFLSKGIAGTGIADVMSAAGLTAGGFYRHFASKEQLIAEANDATFAWLIEQLQTAAAGKPAKEALRAIAALYLRQLEQGSPAQCPLTNLASEFQCSDHKVRATAIAGYQGFVRYLASYAARLVTDDHERLARSLVSTLVGAVTLAKLAADEPMANSILASAQHVVDVLLDATPEADSAAAK